MRFGPSSYSMLNIPCMNFTFKKKVVLIRIVMLCSGKLESGKIVRSLNAVHVLNNKLVTY